MTLIIVLMLLLSYLLIATGHLTGVNKAAIAMFLAAIGWVVYICWGQDFVNMLHPGQYAEFLAGRESTTETVKDFIYDSVFLKHVGKAAAIVMYLLATMSIIEILNNNGCFDFVSEWIRTRNPNRLLWTITLATFILSANLDNLTTTIVMLVIMHQIVRSRPQRMLIGSAIVLAAVCGGCFTVIGDPTGLLLWANDAVTATQFSAYLALPALAAWVVPTMLISHQLPSRIDIEWQMAPYRGDDTRLNRWQRILMLVVAIGGLWFVPTFLSITRLPAFLGALCVLSVLWVVNEAFNRKLDNADQMSQRRIPRVIQYQAIQQMLFVMGIMLGIGVVTETGVLTEVADWIDKTIDSLWVVGIVSGLFSSVVDSFMMAVSDISLYDVWNAGDYARNGTYWKVIAYCTAVGGCLLSIGNISGVALMKMEHIHLGWYLKNITPKVLAGYIIGLAILFAETLLF
ncbi:MAG: sodium:proton antiporter NhaD [Prevotella sp.]|nr:sodium:proton antiporter NhaD [Prevotella sp.]MBR6190167.1 sodium:proton antiporter NhaD [Prevotella sp.]